MADQRAIELLGSEKASLLRKKEGDRSPLGEFFSLFSKEMNSKQSKTSFNFCAFTWSPTGFGRIRSFIAKGFQSLTQTHPSEKKRDELLGKAYDVERLFLPREHGVVTGLAIASIWFAFLLVGVAFDYRGSWALDFILIWINGIY